MTGAAARHAARAAPAAAEPVLLLPPSAPLDPAPAGAQGVLLAGQSMGSTWRLRLAAPPARLAGPAPAALQAGVQAVLDALVAQMSHWAPDSTLSRFNRLPAGAWATLPADFATVMRAALATAAQSGGAFDPALGAQVQAWGFGARQRHDSAGFVPPAAGVPAAAQSGWPAAAFPGVPEDAPPGWRALRLEGDRLRQPGGCALDLSAIAKGHGVDAVAAWLRGHGWRHFLFELGGELAGEGLKPDGQPWWVALERPPGAAALPPLRVGLVGHAVATSGDYRQGFTDAEGRWCCHTLDPRTGAPVRHGLASVSVLHPRCMHADALATALFVLGPDEGLAWATTHGVAAWFVSRTPAGGWHEFPSPALAEWLD